jgi:hypothetical protein|tara:strand:- start:231 stop:449 length:219 start_codon:yes stop_codon:yes gene_type:complete
LPGGAHLVLPPQDGVVLLLQQGLCANYDPTAASVDLTCAVDAHNDTLGVWLAPLIAVTIAGALLLFVVKYWR